MSVAFLDGQLELAGHRFGKHCPVRVIKAEYGAAEIQTQDAPNPVGNGTLMGADRLAGPTWTFDLAAKAADQASALDLIGRFSTSWRTGLTLAPGEVLPLRYQQGGRVRRVYGRPRRLSPPTPNPYLWQGYTAVAADFQCADHLHYDDEARSVTLRLVTSSSGGWVWPAVWPIDTVPGGTRQGVVDDVGGDAPAPFEVTFTGPVSGPWAAGPGWRVEMPTLTLAYDQSVTVSTYPWALTARRNDGADMGDTFSFRTRLLGARIRPGTSEFTFGGIDPSNTATCTLSWRPAWNTL